MKKKKILFQSDYSLAKTGFGRNARAILSYLYKTGKYEIVHYSVGMGYSAPILKKTPWKSVGTLPDSEAEQKALERDPNLAKLAAYGDHYLDRVVREERPDVYIAAQDIWGVDFAIKKSWFNKIPSVIWTTLDSLPILNTALDAAKSAENYWVWSNFATKAMHKEGYGQVKTVHGALDTTQFHKLSDERKKELRIAHKIPKDSYIIGFVFRNQLRKSVPNLLEGFKKFVDNNPKAKDSKLLLHTHFSEGWDIQKLAKENGIKPRQILTTYVCSNCHEYSVKNYLGQNLNCASCKSTKSLMTTNVALGVTEVELNEIYNLMDVYCHPFTSGGQEIPIQEAKLAELITLVTSYSCGEEMCEPEAHSLPLSWHEYREHGSEFRKASTDPDSIAEQLEAVFKMAKKKRAELGAKAREWAIKNFSVESVGSIIEEFVDSQPETDFDFENATEEELRDPYCTIPQIQSDAEWIIFLYENILKMKDVDENNEGFKYWMSEIEKGAARKDVESYFRNIAQKENEESKWKDDTIKSFSELLGKNDEGSRLLYVMPESIGDVYLSTGLFKSLKETYPDYNLYVATKPENFPVLSANPYVYKVIPYIPQMENIYFLEGHGAHKGFFEIAFMPFVTTQRSMCYSHNAKDKITYKDYKYA
jgi:glycosyltransferase involved in cell wall biosynthesis